MQERSVGREDAEGRKSVEVKPFDAGEEVRIEVKPSIEEILLAQPLNPLRKMVFTVMPLGGTLE